MGPVVVVLGPPSLDSSPGVGQGIEPVGLEAVLADCPVEALDEAVLHRLSRLNESQLDPVLSRPAIEGLARKFRSVVDPALPRLPVFLGAASAEADTDSPPAVGAVLSFLL